MKLHRFFSYILMLGLLTAPEAQAQWETSFSFDNAYSDNPFRLPQAQSSWISTFDYSLQNNFSGYALGYNGSFSRFDNMMNRNFYWHQLALFGTADNSYWGFYIEQRLNGSDYNFYDYTNYNVYYNYKFQYRDMNFYWNNDAAINTYSELPELNNFQLSASFKINKSYETGTTIIAGSGLDYKKYLNANPLYTASVDTIDAMSVHTGHGGYGRGYRTYSEVETPSALQAQLWLRLAQSVTPTTGIAIQYHTRLLLTGSNRDAVIFADESQIFDDPMGYESQAIGGELTQLLPWNMKLKGAFYYTEKNYSTQGIYLDEEIYDENELRNDLRKVTWFSLQKNFKTDWFGGSGITMKFTHQWLDNESNSYWYDYNSQYSNFGISVDF